MLTPCAPPVRSRTLMAILHYLRVLCVKLGIACPRCLAVLNYHIVQTYAYADTHHRECNGCGRRWFA